MTYDQYWNEDCQLVVYYRKAHRIRNDRKNEELWLQGMYFYEALCDVSPILHAFAKNGTKPIPYPNRPYALTETEANRRKKDEARQNRKKAMALFSSWADQLDLPENKQREEVNVDADN